MSFVKEHCEYQQQAHLFLFQTSLRGDPLLQLVLGHELHQHNFTFRQFPVSVSKVELIIRVFIFCAVLIIPAIIGAVVYVKRSKRASEEVMSGIELMPVRGLPVGPGITATL
ncbi:UNVERIFIED_CONTAM: hypothetical protein FKN15_053233 [Acipenser sinensis]